MSTHFEFWHKQLNVGYDVANHMIDAVFSKRKSNEDYALIVAGSPHSGKSAFIDHLISTKIFIDKKILDKVGEIIKISYEGYIKVDNIKESEKPSLEKFLKFVEPTISVPFVVAGVNIDFNWEKKISKIISSNSNINIIWIENVNLDTPISIEAIKEIFKENKESNNFYIISTQSSQTADVISSLIPHSETIHIPIFDLKICSEKKQIPPNAKAYPNSLLNKLNKEENVKDLLAISEGAYGSLKLLLEQQVVTSDQKLNKQNIFSSLFLNPLQTRLRFDKDESDLQILLQSFISSSEILSIDWIEGLFSNYAFDYLRYIEYWEERKLIKKTESNHAYEINPLFLNYKDDYLKEFENKTLSSKLAKKINVFLKEDSPEKYDARYLNIVKADSELADEYLFVALLRGSKVATVASFQSKSMIDSNTVILNVLKTPIVDLSAQEIDSMLEKLEEAKKTYFPLLVYAEYAYFYLQLLLHYKREEKSKKRSKIKLQLNRLIHTFNDLVDSGEDEMAIKIGLLLTPQIINYLSKEEHSEAKRIYNWLTQTIYKRKRKNYPYYKRYDIIAKFISTSVLDYKQASYYLRKLIDNSANKNDINEQLISMVFCNLLGISLFLNYDLLEDSLKLYVEHDEKNSDKKQEKLPTKDIRLVNNVALARTCLSKKRIGAKSNEYLSDLKNYEKYDSSHILAINYAGFLFYTKKYKKAKKKLRTILASKNIDDFYEFYCKYNLCLIELLEDVDKNQQSILTNLQNLELPSLFLDQSVMKMMKKRVRILQRIVKKVSHQKPTLENIDFLFMQENHEDIPLFKFAWNFSDYQYWN